MDPASVFGVASAALTVSKKLYELSQKVRHGHHELLRLSESIRRNSVLLRCAVELIEQHESLYKDELKNLVRDINGQFDNITRLFNKILPHKLSRKRERFRAKALAWWSSSKIEELTQQLYALGNTLSLILDIAHLAEMKLLRNQSELATERSRMNASQSIENCMGNIQFLKETEHHKLPHNYRDMLAFDESARDMALWMAVVLSAPGRRAKPMLPPHSSMARGSSKEMQRREQPEALPFGHLVRVVPEKVEIEGSSNLEAIFAAGDINDKTLDIFNLPYSETVSRNGRKVLVVEAEDNAQIDFIIGMNAVLTLPNFEDLTIETSPFMCLPPKTNLCRLLAEWTNMTNQQIRDTAYIEASMAGNEDSGHDSLSSGFPDLDSRYGDDESASNVARIGGRSAKSRLPKQKHPRWNRNRLAFDNQASSRKPGAAGQGRIPETPIAVQFSADDESLDEWDPGPSRVAFRVPKQRNLSQRLNRSIPRSSKQAQNQYPSSSAAHQQMPPPTFAEPPYWYPGLLPQQPPGHGVHPSQNTEYPARPPQAPAGYPVWPVTAVPTPPPPQTSLRNVGKPAGKQKQSASAKPTEDVTSEDLRDTNISMRSSQISAIDHDARKSGKDQGLGQLGREAAPPPDKNNGVTPSIDIKEKEEELRARLKTDLRTEIMTEMTEKGLHAVQVYQDKHRERLEAYQNEVTYDEMYQQVYHDLKRKQAEEEEREKSLRQKIREEIKIELKGNERRHLDEDELRDRVRREAEDDENLRKEIGEQQRMEMMRKKIFEEVMAEVEDRERRARHKDELTEKSDGAPTESAKEDQNSQCDVFSFIDEEPSFSDHGSEIILGGENDDETETTTSDTTQVYPNHERSQPWKGISHLGSCSELVPFYIRGSNAGQTWYHGDDPIYIVEFTEGYNGEQEAVLFSDQRPYLLVDKLWIEVEALEKFGFRYRESPPSYFFLDPSLTCDDIQVLVDFSFALREIRNFKDRGLSNSVEAPNSVSGLPPPLNFFGTFSKDEGGNAASVSVNASSKQGLFEDGKEEASEQFLVDAFLVDDSEENANETEGEPSPAAKNSLTSGVAFIFGILWFALRSIV